MTSVVEHARHPAAPTFLGGAADDPALVTAGLTVTYADLARRVEERRVQLGAVRRLVLLEAANDVESVVTYLAALAGRHPVLMTGPLSETRMDDLLRLYDVDVVQRVGGAIEERRTGSRHELHPDLALLLSTSGSTGSPKLVRLSRDNVLANARSIAEYLALRPDRPGDHLAADPLLLRPVRAQQPPRGRGGGGAHRPLRGRLLLLGPGRLRPGHHDGGRSLHLRAPGRLRLRRPSPALAATAHPGRRPDGPRACRRVRRARSPARVRALRDVRPDRGHRADGLPATCAWPRRVPRRSASRSPEATCRSCRSRGRPAPGSGSSSTPAPT